MFSPLVKSDDFVPQVRRHCTHFRQCDRCDRYGAIRLSKAFETAGTYNGAMGTYKCNADHRLHGDARRQGCKITAMSDGWIFTPAEGATSDVADADYLHYGFWLMRTTDADGATTYNEVETFAEATGIPATGNR